MQQASLALKVMSAVARKDFSDQIRSYLLDALPTNSLAWGQFLLTILKEIQISEGISIESEMLAYELLEIICNDDGIWIGLQVEGNVDLIIREM